MKKDVPRMERFTDKQRGRTKGNVERVVGDGRWGK